MSRIVIRTSIVVVGLAFLYLLLPARGNFRRTPSPGTAASTLVAPDIWDFRALSASEVFAGGSVSEDSAAGRFWLALRLLYEAADKPTLRRLVHLGPEQHPAISISDSTINGWLNGKAVPTGRKNERYLTAMVAFLEGRVKRGTRYERLPPGEWSRLLGAAQAERATGKQLGRPHRPELSSDGDRRERQERATLTGEHLRAGTMVSSALSTVVPKFTVQRGALIGRDRELTLLAGLVKALTSGRGARC